MATREWKKFAGVGLLLCGMFGAAVVVHAEDMSEIEKLQARIEALEAQANESQRQLEVHQQHSEHLQEMADNATTERESRSTWLSDHLTAGHDGGFFLASKDNRFRLNIGGQVQLRYYANFRNDAVDGTDTTTAFQHRRTRLVFSGHVGDPRLTYRIQPEVRRQDGRLAIADFSMSYDFNDDWSLRFGRIKPPFWKEDLHSSGRQLAVERSLVNNIFGQGRSTGVQLAHNGDQVRAYGMIGNGFNTSLHDFNIFTDEEAARIALTGRGEFKLAGDWSQYRHFAGFEGDPFGLILGAAAHYEHNRDARFGSPFADTQDFFSWTADASLYMENVSIFAAVVGRHDVKTEFDADKFDDFGFLAQAGYTINDRFQPFIRYEFIKPDSDRDAHDVSLITAGLNWFIRGHNAKLSTDVVWALDSLSGFAGGSGGLGLLPDNPDEDNQLVIRTQFQLLF